MPFRKALWLRDRRCCPENGAPVSFAASIKAARQSRSSVVEHLLDMEVVGGSIPLATTNSPTCRAGLDLTAEFLHSSHACSNASGCTCDIADDRPVRRFCQCVRRWRQNRDQRLARGTRQRRTRVARAQQLRQTRHLAGPTACRVSRRRQANNCVRSNPLVTTTRK